MYLDFTFETFIDQSSRHASVGKVYTTLENSLASRKRKPTERMCSVATILMDGLINSFLEFIFTGFSCHCTQTSCCFKFQPDHFSAPEKTDFIAKMSQAVYFVIRCSATFSKVRLEISKST